jgi:hypothetical protein
MESVLYRPAGWGTCRKYYGAREEGRDSSSDATTDKVLVPALNLYYISIVRLEGLRQLKNPITLSGIEPASIMPQSTTLPRALS